MRATSGCGLGSDSVSKFNISDEDDTGSEVGSDPGSSSDAKLDTEDIENAIKSDQESDLESDAAGSDSDGDDMDSDNSDASSNFSDTSRSDVSGCSSCGAGERMSSDDETDDKHFDLIKRRHEKKKIRKGKKENSKHQR